MKLFKFLFIKKNHPKIMDEMSVFLKSKGHHCTIIKGKKNWKFMWCNKDICNRPQKDNEIPIIITAMIYFLETHNHHCGIITGTKHYKLEWCEKDICMEKS